MVQIIFFYLPRYWPGCCYYAHLTLPVRLLQMSEQLSDGSNDTAKRSEGYNRKPRSLSVVSKFAVSDFNQHVNSGFLYSQLWGGKFGFTC